MKKKIGIFVLLLVGFALFVAIRFLLLDNSNATGRLEVLSSPKATVFIDNVAIEKDEKIKVGQHLLKLIPEEGATGTASWQKKINIHKNTLTYVNIELGGTDLSTAGEVLEVVKTDKAFTDKGELNIETEPAGAIVYLDNDEKGIAPVLLADIPKGDHELSVFMPGFLRRTQRINITSGYRVNAYIKLAIDPNQSPTYEQVDNIIEATESAGVEPADGVKRIVIQDTPTGWLRVREDATVNASESARVNPGDTFEVLEEKDGWYKVEYEKNKSGWISAEYTKTTE
ncbi:MAG: PEGA domain-containing protein [Patescibacteria group bacterium]